MATIVDIRLPCSCCQLRGLTGVLALLSRGEPAFQRDPLDQNNNEHALAVAGVAERWGSLGRGVSLAEGPTGAIWVVDWWRAISHSSTECFGGGAFPGCRGLVFPLLGATGGSRGDTEDQGTRSAKHGVSPEMNDSNPRPRLPHCHRNAFSARRASKETQEA